MRSQNKKMVKLRKKSKPILMKQKTKSARKSQMTKSGILQLEIKSSVKDNSSLIEWKAVSKVQNQPTV